MSSSPVDLVILAGGRGSRLGGQDKAALVVGGRSLVERLLRDVDLGGTVVVVGRTPLPPAPDGRTVLQTLEDPPDGGPVAGIAAGLDALSDVPTEWVAVAAVDVVRQENRLLRRRFARLGRRCGRVISTKTPWTAIPISPPRCSILLISTCRCSP